MKFKSGSGDPWYIHAILYIIIAVLVVVLIKVAIIDPSVVKPEDPLYTPESKYNAVQMHKYARYLQLSDHVWYITIRSESNYGDPAKFPPLYEDFLYEHRSEHVISVFPDNTGSQGSTIGYFIIVE